MESLEIAESIARDIAIEKRARLDARVAEIAASMKRQGFPISIARIRARVIDAIDCGEMAL